MSDEELVMTIGGHHDAGTVAATDTTPLTDRPFGRPVWRGRMHSWAFVVAIPAGLVLVLSTSGATGRTAAAIYAATLVLLFGTSAAYHRLTRTERARTIMQRVDHSMIYLLVAGTYVPFCLVVLPPGIGRPLLAAVVALAVLGIAMKVVSFNHVWAYAIYPTMGVLVLFAGPALVRNLSAAQLALMLGGAAAYSVGASVLMARRPDPLPSVFGYHEIWHVLTIVAAAMHFLAIRSVLT